LRGATVITMRGDEVIVNADLVIEGNRIAALGPRGQVRIPAGSHIVDATGQYVIPGLIDAHMHFGGIRREILELDDWGTRATLAYGVTSALDPSSLSIDMLAYQDLVMPASRWGRAVRDQHGDVLVQPVGVARRGPRPRTGGTATITGPATSSSTGSVRAVRASGLRWLRRSSARCRQPKARST
jgi:hypothetical protein